MVRYEDTPMSLEDFLVIHGLDPIEEGTKALNDGRSLISIEYFEIAARKSGLIKEEEIEDYVHGVFAKIRFDNET